MVFNRLDTDSYKKEIENRIRNRNLKLSWIDNGIAYRSSNTVYLNSNIIKHPEYCESVIDHELRHSSGWEKKDFIMDLFEGDAWNNFKFMIRYPNAFKQLIPFGKINGKFFIDINLLSQYLMALLILVIMSLLIN